MRFLFPRAMFHFPSQSWGIDLIQSYLFLLQPSCHELTSMVDQGDYGMFGHVASPIGRRVMTTTDEYQQFNLCVHFQTSVKDDFAEQLSIHCLPKVAAYSRRTGVCVCVFKKKKKEYNIYSMAGIYNLFLTLIVWRLIRLSHLVATHSK